MARSRFITRLWLILAGIFSTLTERARVLVLFCEAMELYCLGEINHPRAYVKTRLVERLLREKLMMDDDD